jgi:hypothetical protein
MCRSCPSSPPPPSPSRPPTRSRWPGTPTTRPPARSGRIRAVSARSRPCRPAIRRPRRRNSNGAPPSWVTSGPWFSGGPAIARSTTPPTTTCSRPRPAGASPSSSTRRSRPASCVMRPTGASIRWSTSAWRRSAGAGTWRRDCPPCGSFCAARSTATLIFSSCSATGARCCCSGWTGPTASPASPGTSSAGCRITSRPTSTSPAAGCCSSACCATLSTSPPPTGCCSPPTIRSTNPMRRRSSSSSTPSPTPGNASRSPRATRKPSSA